MADYINPNRVTPTTQYHVTGIQPEETSGREDMGAKVVFPEVERRVVRSCQGRDRVMVRYQGQSRWYANLVTAQFAYQRGAS